MSNPNDGPSAEQFAAMQAAARERLARFRAEQEAQAARAPLHPKVRARQRRIARDPNQFAWDVCGDPKVMLETLNKALPATGMVLLPIARFMDSAVSVARRATGGRAGVEQGTILMALQSSARFLRRADIDAAVDLLMPIVRLVTSGTTPEDVKKMLADVVRELYPCAPLTFKAPPGFVPPAGPLIGMGIQAITDDDLPPQAGE